MSKEIFGLFSGEYSDWSCRGYYTTSEEAERAAIWLTNNGDRWSNNYYVIPLKCLDGTEKLYDGELIYNYAVNWNRKCSERNKPYNHYWIDRTVIVGDGNQKIYEKEVIETLQEDIRIKTNPMWSDVLSCRWHTNHYLTDEQVLKIARDMKAEWEAEKVGIKI